jgi:type I restriction enzyme, S subunit
LIATSSAIPIGTGVREIETWSPMSADLASEFEYIDIAAIDREQKVITTTARTRASDAPSRARQIVQKGDVLVSTVRPALNAVAVVPPSLDGAIASTGFTVLRSDERRLHGPYLFHWVRGTAFIDEMVRLATGASYPAVSDRIIKASCVPVPFSDDPRRSLAEQKRIAAILDKADAIRRRRQEAARLADTLIPSVFYEMFGDPVLNPRRYDTEPLGSLADMVSGGTPSKSVPEFWTGSLPWVSPKDMKRPYLADATDHITEDGADDANLKVLQPGAILIVVRGMILAHTVPLAINLAPLTINQDMRAFVPHDGIEAEYLCWALRMQHGRLLSLVTNAAHGTKRFESRDLFALSVPLPPKPQQKRFAALVESTRLARQRWEAGSDNAEDFFNSLVQRAFRGEL